MWDKVKTFCLNSATIAWVYVLAVASAVLEALDGISDILVTQEFKDQIANVIGNPKVLGRVILGISIVTMITRLRSLRKKDV